MIVVKIGGASGVNLAGVCADVAALAAQQKPVIVVHGGSAETNEISTQLGHPPRFLTAVSGFTSRYTDRTTLEIFVMVTAGKINTLIVEQLQRAGANAFGLTGLDGRLMLARRKDAIRVVENGRQRMVRDDFTGKIESVNLDLLNLLLGQGFVPVIAPLALSPAGEALNVDADRAAAMVAGALQAEHLILLTNVPGLMKNFPDETTLIPRIEKADLEQAMTFAEGRMKKKVLGAWEGLERGVKQVTIADGRVTSPLFNALAGHGTLIV